MATVKSKSKSKPKPKSKSKPAPKAKAKPAPKAKGKPVSTSYPAPPLPPAPLPPDAIERVLVRLTVLGPDGPQSFENGDDISIKPPTLFAVEPRTPMTRRYSYLLQQETAPNAGAVVLLLVFDAQSALPTRLPPAGAWQRAVVRGKVRLLASELQLTRAQIVSFIGGHEPPPTDAKPPYT